MPGSSRCWRRRFLLLWSSVDFTVLGATDKTLDEVHVLCNDCLINAMGLEITEECSPGWVDARRCEAFFWIVAHVGDMDK